MMKIFNSDFELSMRALLILETCVDPVDIDTIKAIDLLTIYGKQFGIAEVNLHGDSSYSFSEVASGQEQFKAALKSLVRDGFVSVHVSPTGFLYSINSLGSLFCNKLSSDYAVEYRKLSSEAANHVRNTPKDTLWKSLYGEILRRE